MSGTGRVVVIGIDGADLDLLEPWIAERRLPNIAALMKTGSVGRLTSVRPCHSGPAWSSLLTGKNPGKHGIYSFTLCSKRPQEMTRVNLSCLEEPAIWDILGHYDKQVGVVGLPMTYPPLSIDGCMVSGDIWRTHADDAPFASPTDLECHLRERFGRYYCDVSWMKETTDNLINYLYHATKKQEEAIHVVLDQFDCDLYIFTFIGTDRLQHALWSHMDAQHPTHDPSTRHADEIRKYYQLLDEIIGGIVARCGANTYYLLCSDHGFGPLHGTVHLNKWLADRGYLHLKQTVSSLVLNNKWRWSNWLRQLHVLGLRLAPIPSSTRVTLRRAVHEWAKAYDPVDWSQTRAYQRTISEEGLFINLNGREAHGIVGAGREYEALRQELSDGLMALRHPQTGESLVQRVIPKEEVIWGPHLDVAPDLLLDFKDSRYIAGADFASKALVTAPGRMTGRHRPEGIFAAAGPGIKRNSIVGASIMDIAPTILHLLGLPVLEDMDGNVLDILENDVEIQYVAELPVVPSETVAVLSADEEVQLVKQLEGLGYL